MSIRYNQLMQILCSFSLKTAIANMKYLANLGCRLGFISRASIFDESRTQCQNICFEGRMS